MRGKCPGWSGWLMDMSMVGFAPCDPTPSSQRRTEAGSRTSEVRRRAARAKRGVLDAAEYDARLQPIVGVLAASHGADGHQSACVVEHQQDRLVTLDSNEGAGLSCQDREGGSIDHGSPAGVGRG